MKVSKQKQFCKVSGDVQTKDFGIVFDRHMVNILSNQLYEDKILAIVRELSTNAYDSQVENGNSEKPFKVHVPTIDTPNFSIRDYGVGMSPEKVDNTYRNYGASDRNESNNFTGCMGLGSKTPFCYHTRTFTVDSWHNGIHYTYACYLNEDGMPQISKMSEKPSGAPSGVKITLPVKSRDFYEFIDSCKNVYKFFATKPEINTEIPEIVFDMEDNEGRWKYSESERYSGMHVVMGNVAYPVTASALGDLNSAQRSVVNCPFFVYVDIGEVGVTASREGLDYTNRTKTHIRGFINQIIANFNQKVENEINSCKNLWEARLKYIEFSNQKYRSFYDPSKITYNGSKLFEDDFKHIEFDDMLKDEEIDLISFFYSAYRNPEQRKTSHIRPKSNPLFYENDLKVGAYVRSKFVCKDQKKAVYLVKFKTKDSKSKFMARVGIDESYFNKISKIPSPTIRTAGKSRGKTSSVVQLKHGGSISYCWSNVEHNMDIGGFYVEFNRYNIVRKNNNTTTTMDPRFLNRILSRLEDCGIKISIVYGIKTADIKKVKNNPKWICVFDYIEKVLKEKYEKIDIEEILQCRNAIDKIGITGYYSNTTLNVYDYVSLFSYLPENYFLSQVVDYQNKLKKINQARIIDTLINEFGIKVNKRKSKKVEHLKPLEEKFYEKYPLLNFLDHRCDKSNSFFENVSNYIKMIEGESK